MLQGCYSVASKMLAYEGSMHSGSAQNISEGKAILRIQQFPRMHSPLGNAPLAPLLGGPSLTRVSYEHVEATHLQQMMLLWHGIFLTLAITQDLCACPEHQMQ